MKLPAEVVLKDIKESLLAERDDIENGNYKNAHLDEWLEGRFSLGKILLNCLEKKGY
jgi:hypothetical protein